MIEKLQEFLLDKVRINIALGNGFIFRGYIVKIDEKYITFYDSKDETVFIKIDDISFIKEA